MDGGYAMDRATMLFLESEMRRTDALFRAGRSYMRLLYAASALVGAATLAMIALAP